MWLDRLIESPVMHALELTARFAEQRHLMLAEDIANIDTPDYRARRLDPQAFQSALREAWERADKSGAKRLELRGNAQVWTDERGRLRVRPVQEPPPNALFHDGSNPRLETLMSDLQQNALTYRLALNLLRRQFDGLLTAIRGRVQ